ncbi:MAG: ATP-binding protein [Phycisphaerae bacterium]
MGAEQFEKLGAFYLGREYDLSARARRDSLVLYDSRDLVTHGVCVGMTGSGKTGLCLGVIEEAAIDGIPVIAIDPKGDLPNLLLTFPALSAGDFAPWINEDDARRKGVAPAEFAAQQADLWRRGLAEWGQDAARIQRLRDAAEFVVYTPGSSAGLPVSLLKSFDPPEAALREEADLYRERVASVATSLLALLGIEADPLRGREHILLSTIVDTAWREGRSLDLAAIVQQVQTPPVTRIGVMELEGFFPAADRFALAMQLNNLLASPGFSSWVEGQPLDIQSILYTPAGKPRVAIFSIAHLGDAERMFFVSTLLNQVLAWTRRQSGTTSLRALLYMDEIAGYCPPVTNVPAKAPLLTLMKQARAFGVGVLLATQNPVDLDYKGLSNAGTWFIGRLQTERDKARVLDGLEGAAASASATFNRAAADQALSQLGSRVFMLNNVHEDGPRVFETRWVLSYLRGPLTRNQIKLLMDGRRTTSAPATLPAESAALSASQPPAAAPASIRASSLFASNRTAAPTSAAAPPGGPPMLPPEVQQFYVAPRSAAPPGARLLYAPALLGNAMVHFADSKTGVELDQPVGFVTTLDPGPVTVDWNNAIESELDERDLQNSPAPDAEFASLPPPASKAKSYDAWKRDFADLVARRAKIELLVSPGLDETSHPNESERDFRVRLAQAARELRDEQVAKLRQKYAPKVATLEERLRRAKQQLDVQQQQAREAKMSTAVSFGSALLSAFLGKKAISAGSVGKAGTAIRGVGRSMRESSDVGRAEETVEAITSQMRELDAQFNADLAGLESRIDPTTEPLDKITVRPKKTQVKVRLFTLAWVPQWRDASGEITPAL